MPLGTKKSTYQKVALNVSDEEMGDVAACGADSAVDRSDGEEDDSDVEVEAVGAQGAPTGALGRLAALLPAMPTALPGAVGAPSLGPCVNLKDSRHPWVAFFHVFFKAAALVTYVLGSWFTSSFVLVFVVCILLLAMDFWTVKNVSGRLLVGLRWWNEIDEEGQNVWMFESIQDPSELIASDSTLFWTALVGAPALWCTFALTALLSLKLSWLFIVIVAVSLQCSNVLGYYRCRKDAGKQMQDMVAQGMVAGLTSQGGAGGLASLFGAAAGAAGAAAGQGAAQGEGAGGDGGGGGGSTRSDAI